MYADRDFDLHGRVPANAPALTQDLELDVLFEAMAAGDPFLLEVAQHAVLTSLETPEAIRYRQHILADCLERPEAVRQTYAIAVEALEREKKIWGWTSLRRSPGGTLHRCVEVLKLFAGLLKRLRHIVEEQGTAFRSEGFTTLFRMLATELDDEYLMLIQDHLRQLAFRDGVVVSAELGESNTGTGYVLRKPPYTKQGWWARLQNWREGLARQEPASYVYQIADRDESGFRALEELRNRGIARVAAALGESTEHILSFFAMLRTELAFYIGCLNLRDRLARKGEPLCLPEPLAIGQTALSGRGLYDVCLSLSLGERVIGNDVRADDKLLVMITGANRGGKSTFLRAIGQAQLMMQCGLFVPAECFRANVCTGIHTHYKREEDVRMNSGKLDEELYRMSAIIDRITAHSIVLFNESFGSTNEREGSEIARQIVRALVQRGIKVFYVTHLFDLAHGFASSKMGGALFLRAERLADRRRTFRLEEGQPLPTSYGEDLYRRIFGTISVDAPTARD